MAVGEDYSGTSGFVSTPEGADATLNVLVSEDSARNLWDVQAAIQQIAADFQTAVRAASDFQSYLISIRETSQTVKMPQMAGIEGGGGGTGGTIPYEGRVDTNSVPSVQAEAAMSGRIAEMEENSSGAGGGAMGSSSRANERPVDVGGFIGQMTTAAWMMQQQVGEQGGGGGRGGGGGIAQGAQAISSGIPAAQQFLRGGGLGGAAGLLTRFGAYGAAGYAAYQAIDAGLETYAQSRAMAISANNSSLGTGWGFGQRVSQAGMALSPFVSQEQAANIFNTAVGQGWAAGANGGRGFAQGNFGQALNFMYDAAKDYQMDPEMSAQLLKVNSLGAGESVQALSQQLLTLKQTLDGTGVSMDAATSSFTSLTGPLIAAGASPQMAAQFVGGALKGYAGNTYLGPSGRGAEISTQTLLGQQGQNIIAGMTGTLPGAILTGEHFATSSSQLQKLTSQFADQVLKMSGLDPGEKAAMFQQLYNGTFGQNISIQDASNLIAENASNKELLDKGQREWLDRGRIGNLEHQNSFQSWWQGLDDWQGAASAVAGNGRSAKDMETASSMINSFNYYSPEVNALLSNASDLSKVQLFDENGNPVQVDGDRVAGVNIAKWFSDQSNYEKFSKRGSGYYITDEQGNKYNESNIGLGGVDAGALANGANEANTVYITLSPEAKAYFATNKDKIELDTGHN